jgi:hypothetical protein
MLKNLCYGSGCSMASGLNILKRLGYDVLVYKVILPPQSSKPINETKNQSTD